jgi:hypothetical protein
MKFKLVVLAFCLLFVGSTAFSETYYLPHVGLGSYGSGSDSYGFTTTFVFFNNTTTNANVTLKLTNDDGTPMSATIPELGTKSTFSFVLPQAATLIYETDNSGDVRSGAATITTDNPIGVSSIFTLYNNNTGNFVTEVGVANSNPVNNFVIPAQVTANGAITTTLALFNPGSSNSALTLSLKNEDGTSVGSVSDYPLAAGQHKAVYLFGQGQLFPDITSFTGTITISSSAAISAMALRQNAPSAALTYTSIPVVEASSGKTQINLAQFADGSAFKTTFMIFNLSSSAANVTIALKNDDGSAFPVTIGATTNDTFTYSLGAGQSRFLQTNGTGSATGASGAGAAIITSNVKIGAAGLFTQYNGDGSFNTEAGVQDSPTYTSLTLPIDSKPAQDPDTQANIGSDTGIALFNPTSSDITLNPIFLDQDGLSTTANAITLPAHGHYANFFGSIFPDMGVIQGSFNLSGLASGISVMTLRMNLSPFSMTSLPVIDGATAGFTNPSTGAGGTRTGVILPNVAVTANTTTINRSLMWGYGLTVTTAGFPTGGFAAVEAISTSGRIYTPYISTVNTIYVSPGVFTVRVLGTIGTSNSVNGIWLTYTVPDLVTVTAATTVTPTIPSPTLYNVTGTISGIANISSATGSKLVFISTDSGPEKYTVYCDQTSGSFTQQFPPGTYIAAIQAQGFGSSSGTENADFYNIGTFTVEDGDMNVDLALPDFAALSGSASFTGNIPSSVTIRAADNSLPPSFNGSNYIKFANTATALVDSGYHLEKYVTPSVWTAPTTGFTGAYDMSLVKGGDYQLTLSYLVYDSASTTAASGTITYTPSMNEVILAGDGTFNFTNIPSSPQLVTLTGSFGTTVYSHVIAVSTSLRGMPNMTYRAETIAAGTTGTWTLKVPKGNYRVYLPSFGTPFVVP